MERRTASAFRVDQESEGRKIFQNVQNVRCCKQKSPNLTIILIVIIYRVIEKDGRDWNLYNLKRTGRIYTFGVLKCSEKFKVLDLP